MISVNRFQPFCGICVALLALLVSDLRAQEQSGSVPVLSRGDVQAGAFGGFSYGQSFNRLSTKAFRAGLTELDVVTPSSNGSVGGRIEVSLTRRLLVQSELAYVGGGHLIFNQDYVLNQPPLITRRVSIDGHSSSALTTAGLEMLFPLQRRLHVVPYAGLGAGLLRTRSSLKQGVLGGAPGQTFSGTTDQNHALGYVSAGMFYYFVERVGIFVDTRVLRGSGVSTFGRLSVGLFVKIR